MVLVPCVMVPGPWDHFGKMSLVPGTPFRALGRNVLGWKLQKLSHPCPCKDRRPKQFLLQESRMVLVFGSFCSYKFISYKTPSRPIFCLNYTPRPKNGQSMFNICHPPCCGTKRIDMASCLFSSATLLRSIFFAITTSRPKFGQKRPLQSARFPWEAP